MLSSLLARPAAAAITFGGSGRESARNASSIAANVTVPNTPNTILLVALDLPPAPSVVSVTSNGFPLTRLSSIRSAPAGCRVETWVLMNPAPGTHQVLVNLDSLAAFGFGAASYSGVDRSRPPTVVVGIGADTLITLAPSDGQIGAFFGSACATGTGNRGGSAGDGQTFLWDFTGASLVGLGGHRLAPPWTLSWALQTATPWAIAGVLLREPGVLPPPDAGTPVDANPAPDVAAPAPDVAAPDVAPVVDTRPPAPDQPIAADTASPVPDSSAPPDMSFNPDASARDAPSPADALPGDGRSDASKPPDGQVPSDATPATDAGGGLIDTGRINLQVGCACDVGSPNRPTSSGPGLLLVGVVMLLRRRRGRSPR
ncbi:MAG TPA: MYXO-CTERM sorting domain-containing protein [Polyangia bacterium]